MEKHVDGVHGTAAIPEDKDMLNSKMLQYRVHHVEPYADPVCRSSIRRRAKARAIQTHDAYPMLLRKLVFGG